jgi:hypothetical protein
MFNFYFFAEIDDGACDDLHALRIAGDGFVHPGIVGRPGGVDNEGL